MDKIIYVVKQVITPDIASFIWIGLGFVLLAIVIGVFKQYWLIAGVNTMSKKEKEKIDLEYVGKYFGIFMGIMGFIFLITPFIFRFLNIMDYLPYFLFIAVIAWVVFLFLYGHHKRNRIYK